MPLVCVVWKILSRSPSWFLETFQFFFSSSFSLPLHILPLSCFIFLFHFNKQRITLDFGHDYSIRFFWLQQGKQFLEMFKLLPSNGKEFLFGFVSHEFCPCREMLDYVVRNRPGRNMFWENQYYISAGTEFWLQSIKSTYDRCCMRLWQFICTTKKPSCDLFFTLFSKTSGALASVQGGRYIQLLLETNQRGHLSPFNQN